MRLKIICASGSIALALAFTGCGKQGFPEPPSLNLPLPPKDLRAARKADKVTLAWTQPRMTTDQAIASKIGQTRICRSIAATASEAITSCSQSIGEVAAKLPVRSDSPTVTATFNDLLSEDVLSRNPSGFAIYAVEVQNRNGNSGGLSNEVAVPLVPTLLPPNFTAELRADGVHITITPSVATSTNSRLRFGYRITRASSPSQPKEAAVTIAQLAAGETVSTTDSSFEWEKHYKYVITPYSELLAPDGRQKIAQVDGADSAPVEIFTHDLYPPAVPTGLQAVYSNLPSQRYIDLTWTPNTEDDLAGYNIYRNENGNWRRINAELAKTPAFRDANVAAGQSYTYSVSAVDLRGNESAKSQSASEAIPRQ